jgi:hypothetical protein
LLKLLEVAPGEAQNTDTLRLKRAMRRLGWDGPKKFRFGETTKRGYARQNLKTGGTGGTTRNMEHEF